MKSKGTFGLGLAVVIVAGMLAACTTNPRAASTPPPRNGHTIVSTYTQDDIKASGRTDTAEALQQLDPDIQARRPH
jgi:hypothetical protein